MNNVEVLGKDGTTHVITVEASSLFDAANKAIETSCRLWWFDPKAVAEGRGRRPALKVDQARVREWRKNRM
jgi:hypothetical protein